MMPRVTVDAEPSEVVHRPDGGTLTLLDLLIGSRRYPDAAMVVDVPNEPPGVILDDTVGWRIELDPRLVRRVCAQAIRAARRIGAVVIESGADDLNLADSDALDWIAAQDRHRDRREATLSMMEAAAGRRLGDPDYQPPLILGARRLADIPTDPPPPLLIDRLDPDGHTILFGTGGVGKGTLACEWIVRLGRTGSRTLILDYENHPGEWARRISSLGGTSAVDRVTHAAPLTAGWLGRRGPLWEQAEDIATLIDQSGVDYVVVDSIVPACAGMDPTRPETVALYAGGLEYIGIPALSLGHVTKADDLRYPFGSVFWHNLCRGSWSLKSDGNETILCHRKSNNYERAGSFTVSTTWQDGALGEVWERPYSLVLADRIAEALAEEPLGVADLVARLEEDDGGSVKPDSVRTALRRGIKARKFTKDGDRYGLAT